MQLVNSGLKYCISTIYMKLWRNKLSAAWEIGGNFLKFFYKVKVDRLYILIAKQLLNTMHTDFDIRSNLKC